MPPKRPRPRDLGQRWPAARIADASGEVARRFVLALEAARDGRSLRELAALTGVDHTTIADVLHGNSWPDLVTIARLERGLGCALWPVDHFARGEGQR